jgi:hypothetical protein
MDSHLLRFRKDINYCLIDLETFNLCLNFQQNRFWQVGALDVIADKITKAYNIHVNWPDAPHLKIGEGAKIVTRFDQAKHDSLAVNANEAFSQIWTLLKKVDYILGHNILSFDLYLLKGWAEMNGEDWKWIPKKIIDTDALSRGYKLNIKYNPEKDNLLEYQYRMASTIVKGCKTNLTAMGKEFGIEYDYDNLHDATNDIILNLKIWDQLKYKVEI